MGRDISQRRTNRGEFLYEGKQYGHACGNQRNRLEENKGRIARLAYDKAVAVNPAAPHATEIFTKIFTLYSHVLQSDTDQIESLSVLYANFPDILVILLF